MIPDVEVQRAENAVIRAGVADALRGVLSPKGTGDQSQLRVETCLTGFLLSIQNGFPMTYESVRHMLTRRISIDEQWRLGTRYIDKHGVERTITRRPIENMFNQIGDRLAFLPQTTPKLPQPERDRRRRLLQWVMNGLVDAGKPNDLPPTGEYALDSTGIWAWARAR